MEFPQKPWLRGGMKHYWLVVWSIFLFFHLIIGNVIIPIDELVFFRGVGLNHQPDQLKLEIWNLFESGNILMSFLAGIHHRTRDPITQQPSASNQDVQR